MDDESHYCCFNYEVDCIMQYRQAQHHSSRNRNCIWWSSEFQHQADLQKLYDSKTSIQPGQLKKKLLAHHIRYACILCTSSLTFLFNIHVCEIVPPWLIIIFFSCVFSLKLIRVGNSTTKILPANIWGFCSIVGWLSNQLSSKLIDGVVNAESAPKK